MTKHKNAEMQEYYNVELPKLNISTMIRKEIDESELSVREIAARVNRLHYTQIYRMLNNKNYTVDTFLRAMEALGFEVHFKETKAPYKKITIKD